ncbi:MAG: hypothetical protein M1814_005477 [Vezdaea aestivalis]|nr:MAG: hypothetical protein M1814_005477 [Vezdaea aestivalis]
MPQCREVDIENLSISQIQSHLQAQSFTCKELTECYLKRIELLNSRIKAVIETNPDALTIAHDLDIERQNGKVRSRIHGIPFLVKDNISTRDKMETTAGCAALVGTKPPNDARVVTLLRAADGVLLGKSNLSEWASMRASYYSEAYSSRGGQNRNPYNLAEHPGGSSSGSASALAANMCAFRIKPTVGLTSMQGVIPEAPSMDTVGTFGRSVEDATIVLEMIAKERLPPVHRLEPIIQQNGETSYTSWLATKEALEGAKFGMPMTRVWEAARKSETHRSEYIALMKFIKQIEEAGAQVFDVGFASAKEIISPDGWNWEYGAGKPGSKLSEFGIVKVEFYRSLREYLSTLGNNKQGIISLENVIAYNIEHTDKEGGVPGTHPAWPTGQDNFDRSVKAKDLNDSEYSAALRYNLQKSRDEGIDAALKHEIGELDGLLVPLQAEQGVACSVAAKAGYPIMTTPVGVDDTGVPFGLGIMQTAWKENDLIRYASAIEDLIHHRHRPKFLNFDAENYTCVGNPPDEASKS